MTKINRMASDWAGSLLEDGDRDWRMLPVALAMWATMLGVHAWFERCGKGPSRPPFPAPASLRRSDRSANLEVSSSLMVVLLAVVLLVVAMSVRSQAGRLIKIACMLVRWPWTVMVICAAMIATEASMAVEYTQMRDPAIVATRQGDSFVVAVMRLTSPVTAASTWQADCQANAVIESFEHGNIVTNSHSRVQLFASGSTCGSIDDGQTIRVHGKIQSARYGSRPVWLTVTAGSKVTLVTPASLPMRIAASMRRSFFSVTERLPDQGRVLVPGLTIGLLGQDFVGDRADGTEPVNATFAKLLEMHFRNSGIIHLMAVSGGHFALVGEFVKRCCALVRMPRQAVALLSLMAYFGLAGLMFPSDSVLRALAMGTLAALSMTLGRRAQPLSSLSWTVIAVLLFDPSMARSFGFALSCAAVLGIVLCTEPLTEWLNAILPLRLAQATSVTLAAQAFTLPVQVLMTPQLPLLALPANLIVAPFVNWSTVTGLLALLLSPLGMWPAYSLAWLSSLGTEIMRWCADMFGTLSVSTLPCVGGPSGALLVLVCEILAITLARESSSWIRRRTTDEPEFEGERFVSTWPQRMATWIHETEQMFESR
ncbi:ComEC/Rec2-related protein [Bifidobacterium bohemicum]|uniref:Putative transmembrane protein related to ComA n=1 Tax=Bifidobacterium bohemicum DSM 22767 TaxID=1437606 RepID=A0A086ZJ86_9BIFI|nr:ComEC/Rec2 family competence protein [Bifidobacterium bohemicum]KFI46586.1 putative transmembrane protein related to ComA [Bifidobacterium bohemicum DSM 22767]SCB75909.1 ComEC/Rec2-related protein [Bifidobacterium bohemicum]